MRSLIFSTIGFKIWYVSLEWAIELREHKLRSTTIINIQSKMFLRSELSLLNDELNFTWILSQEVKALVDSQALAITPNQRLELVCIYLKLLEIDIVDSAIIRELSELLGVAYTALLESRTEIRARLETDFANSGSQPSKP